MNLKEIRWKQRFENFQKAFQQLEEAVSREKLNSLERSGLVQTFEFTFELAWKTLKDYLESEGMTVQSPRETLKKAFQSEYIVEGGAWIDALEKRNLLAHTYNEKLSLQACDLVRKSYFPLLKKFAEDFVQRI